MVERVFNKQAFAHSVETPFFSPLPYLNVNFDDTVEGKTKTVLGTVKGNPGSNGPKNKESKNIASHHHGTTSTMGCLLLFQDS